MNLKVSVKQCHLSRGYTPSMDTISDSIARILSLAPVPPELDRIPPQDVPRAVYEAVDLDIAHSPILPPNMPLPLPAVKQTDGRYTVDGLRSWFGGGWSPDTFNVPAEEIRLWRARYLIMRDLIYHALVTEVYRYVPWYDLCHYPTRERVLGAFFPGGVFIPGKDNPLRKGFDPEKPPHVFADGSIAAEVTSVP